MGAILLGETKNAAGITQLMENKNDVGKYKEKYWTQCLTLEIY